MNPNIVFKNAKVYTPNGVLNGGCVVVKNGKIDMIYDGDLEVKTGVKELNSDFGETIDLQGAHLIPGFIDVHVHGGGGYDAMAGRFEEIDGMSVFHAQHGTTSFVPTTLTADRQSNERAIISIIEAIEKGTQGAEVLGVHLEGPFINEKRSGAQNCFFIRNPNIEELERYYSLAKGFVKLITLAPELPGATEFIEHAVTKGITISIGHSDATYEIVKQAIKAGASHITHLFNGMRPLHHREPGVAGAALMQNELTVELICDGYHIHRDLINFVFQTKHLDNIVLITDAVSAAGQPEGDDYDLGGLPCYMKNGQVRLKDSDDLAGSCLTMDQALRNVLEYTQTALQDILPTLTINPAKQIGVANQKGSIEIGKDADLVILNHNYQVQATYVKGKKVYHR